MLTQEQLTEAIKEFKIIFKEKFGINITDEQATIQGKKLLELMLILTNQNQP